ncbi:unnamed protein product [Penicillium viridicatum]
MVPGDPPKSMDDIAEGPRRVLNHIENNGTEDRYVTGYIRAVRQYALNAQRGDAMETAKQHGATSVLEIGTAAWPRLRHPTPGATARHLQEYQKLSFVKVGPNREQIRALPPKELVERAERQRATIARQKNSTALAGRASFVAAHKLSSGDVAMVANIAAGAELLCKHTEWPRAFGPGPVVQEPSWGVVAYNIPVRSMKLTPETWPMSRVSYLHRTTGAKLPGFSFWLADTTRYTSRRLNPDRVHKPSRGQPRDHHRHCVG